MSLTVTESLAVNTLLLWLLRERLPADGDRRTPTPGEARDAAELLADHANKTLSAGLDGARVHKAWYPTKAKDKS